MSDEIKKGLLGIVVDETEVSKVMPEINSLTYRGYAAQDLCQYCKFEEVAYLILNKDLPNSIQLKQFEKEEKNNRELSKNLYEIIKHMPKKSHPMDVARTAVSVMGLEDKETSNSTPEANMRKALRIFAKTPTALAAFYRLAFSLVSGFFRLGLRFLLFRYPGKLCFWFWTVSSFNWLYPFTCGTFCCQAYQTTLAKQVAQTDVSGRLLVF